MCTVTWMRQDDGYVLLCNRDERNSRLPAIGPQINELRGVKYVAPVDGNHGGSWIGANQFGLSLCLLNRYGTPQLDETREHTSRGLLLIELLDCRHPVQVAERLKGFELDRFQQFTMLALGRDSEPKLMEWNGTTCSVSSAADSLVPLSSTSFMEPGIAESRTSQFHSFVAAAGLSAELLDQFHRSHLPTRGPASVCMHREGAATVSLSKVLVGREGIEFLYEAGSPCTSGKLESVRL